MVYGSSLDIIDQIRINGKAHGIPTSDKQVDEFVFENRFILRNLDEMSQQSHILVIGHLSSYLTAQLPFIQGLLDQWF